MQGFDIVAVEVVHGIIPLLLILETYVALHAAGTTQVVDCAHDQVVVVIQFISWRYRNVALSIGPLVKAESPKLERGLFFIALLTNSAVNLAIRKVLLLKEAFPLRVVTYQRGILGVSVLRPHLNIDLREVKPFVVGLRRRKPSVARKWILLQTEVP